MVWIVEKGKSDSGCLRSMIGGPKAMFSKRMASARGCKPWLVGPKRPSVKRSQAAVPKHRCGDAPQYRCRHGRDDAGAASGNMARHWRLGLWILLRGLPPVELLLDPYRT